MNKEIASTSLLVLLWSLSAGGKLADFNHFEATLNKQLFSKEFSEFLLYAVPASEMAAAFLLLSTQTRLIGFITSLMLLSLFTAYIGLILIGYYNKIPCACISIIAGMGFKAHFFFNLFFLAVATMGFILTLFKRKEAKAESI